MKDEAEAYRVELAVKIFAAMMSKIDEGTVFRTAMIVANKIAKELINDFKEVPK